MSIELIQAARQALPALENSQPHPSNPVIGLTNQDFIDREETIRQLRAAIQQAEAQQPTEQDEQEADGLPPIVAGAIFDFAGFMTTRSKVIEVGSTAEAGPVADLVKEWAELRGLDLANAAVLSWQLHITRASLPATGEPVKATPYNPTEEMRWAMKRIDPALSSEQCRALWSAAWCAAPSARPAPSAAVTTGPVAWRNVIPGGRKTDEWESTRIADYNLGWNAYRKAAKTALEHLETSTQPLPSAWMYTLEYGGTIADTKVSLRQLNYPFGVCGADYLRENSDGISYVRQTPIYTHPAPSVPADVARDAERYRFIRDADVSDDLIPDIALYAMESLDEYIDAAMLAAKETK